MSWLAIDFGTSVSSAAYINNNGELRKISFTSPHDSTKYDFPTTAWVDQNHNILVGYQANANASNNPANYIFEFKLDLDSPIENTKGNVSYVEVVAAILKEIKREAEMLQEFTNVVITIPVDFKQMAIDIIKDAALQAGFQKVEFVTEPQAAAIYFNNFAKQGNVEWTALIYDMGCGTFDPAIIKIKNSDSQSDYSLPINGSGTKKAGKHFDLLIQNYFEVIHPIPNHNRAEINREFKRKCREEIKHMLKNMEVATTSILYGGDGEKTFELRKIKFNEMIDGAIEESLTKCQSLIDDSQLTWQDIDVIFFVGGSCNISHVRSRVEAYARRYNTNIRAIWNTFNEIDDLEPQYAVCLGAALYISHKNNNEMNPKIYTEKRDTLISIINKILKIEKLGDDKKKEFEVINKKCLEDQFNIVLVGEFQGGKSTTFNTFCDGREISPRGAMVKTSACRITARNLSDSTKQEYAEVVWKTNRELILNIEDILSKHISIEDDLGIKYQPGDEIKSLSELLSFSNEHVEMMNKAISKEWDCYEKYRAGYSSDSLDILRIATVILRFVNTEDAKKLKGKNFLSITDISKHVVFPKDWEEKWRAGVNARFRFDEVQFAFVASVDCFIHSPNLSRLGCTITDCPGLFASKWDTQVALDTIPKADAILYLLNGSRAIGTGDVASLREIGSMPAAHKKIFFSINMKNPRPIIDNSIVPVDVAIINNDGFNIKEQNIHRYHALLAFLAEFGQKYIDNKLDETSRSIFLSMSKQLFGDDLSIEQSWTMQATQHLMLTSSTLQRSINSITQESVNQVRSVSGFNELFGSIEEFIIKNKAESILITNGAEKCSLALTNIENSLKNREEEASENVIQRETELALAKQKLIEFQTEAKAIVTGSFGEKIFEQLKNDYYEDVLMASSNDICLIVAPKLDKKLTSGLGWKMLLKSKKEREELMKSILTPIYQDALSEILTKRTKVWLTSLVKGENESYKNSVSREINSVNSQINSKWAEVQELRFKFPQVELPDPYELNKIVMRDGNVSSPIFESDILGSFYKIARNNLFTAIILSLILSPLALFGLVIELIDFIVSWFRGKPEASQQIPEEKIINSYDDLSDDQKGLYNKILPQLKSTFGDRDTAISLKESIWDSLLSKIASGLKNLYTYNLSEQEKKFTKDYEDRGVNLRKSTDERKKVADEAKNLRTTQIEPCNLEVKAFMDSTIKILKKNGAR